MREPLRGEQKEGYSHKRVANLIDGRWLLETQGPACIVRNPANGKVINQYLGASAAAVDQAMVAAAHGARSWERMPAHQRGLILLKAAEIIQGDAEQLAVDLTLEQGKTYRQSRAEIAECVEILKWFAEQGKRAYGRTIPSRSPEVRYTVEPRSVGPVAVFTPWNSPLATSVRTAAPALSAGCTVILKPSEETPSAVMGVAEALMAAGMPNGVFNVLFGEPAAIANRLISSPRVRKISFTGSVAVGRKIAGAAGSALKPASLELGGHAPVLIFDDADIPTLARLSTQCKFDNAGQICTAPTRFFIQREVYRPFIDALRTEIEGLIVGEGWLERVDMGPLANERRLTAMHELVDDAVRNGAGVVTGGRRLGQYGYFYAPTLLADVPETCRVMTEEPFGPLICATPFDAEDEALAKANGLPYGLAGYVFTADQERQSRIQAELDVGMIGVNSFDISVPETPFTGIKDSGYGYACGEEGFESFRVNRLIARGT
jgi:succinate-semialdehyde dehydrogenase / glutarate-semialdehyde dehydrogenase